MDKKKCSEFVDNKNNLGARIKTNTVFGDNDLTTWLVARLRPRKGMRVLDVGFGDGNHLRHIAPIVGGENLCVGIDYDRGMVAKAKALSKNIHPAIRFIHMDMDTVGNPGSPFADDSFDLIYSVYAFYYSKNIHKTLDQLKRKLAAGGRIAITGPTGDNNKNWFDFLQQFMEIPKPILVSSRTFMDDVARWAKKNFTTVTSHAFVNTITIPSLGDLRDYWVSNIYYEKRFDPGFERYGREHFKSHKAFMFAKKAKMILMHGKK